MINGLITDVKLQLYKPKGKRGLNEVREVLDELTEVKNPIADNKE